jgi:hypothetical protein
MGFLVTVVLATLLGYLTGFLSFKVKTRWCGVCGAVKSCPDCANTRTPRLGAGDSGTGRRFGRVSIRRAFTR